MSEQKSTLGEAVRRELIWLVLLATFGVFLLPIAVYLVGGVVFGDYTDGLPAFLREIWGSLGAGNPGTWFLVFSPYLAWLAARLTWRAVRAPRKPVTD